MNNREQTKDDVMLLRPYTPEQLASLYGVSKKDFRTLIAPYKEEIGRQSAKRLYRMDQVKTILEKLGPPEGKVIDFPTPVRYPDEITWFVNAAWDFTRLMLWPEIPVCEEEITLCKNFLGEYFSLKSKAGTVKSMTTRFSVFCQRIILARDFITRGQSLTCPARWLDPGFSYGYHLTFKKFRSIQRERKERTYFHEELEVIADLYYEYRLLGSADGIIAKADAYLSKRFEYNLLNIFSGLIRRLHGERTVLTENKQ